MPKGGAFSKARTIEYTDAAAVTPDNATDLPDGPCKGLWVGGAGALVVDTLDGTTVTITAVPAGTHLPLSVKRVRATGTVASAILALYGP